ncbi:hypothetical protein CLBKI_51480 [Clostridium beijerinckii]|nr:hypothetical protein CLBKI_51480 [Clostridium beijerinckii]
MKLFSANFLAVSFIDSGASPLLLPDFFVTFPVSLEFLPAFFTLSYISFIFVIVSFIVLSSFSVSSFGSSSILVNPGERPTPSVISDNLPDVIGPNLAASLSFIASATVAPTTIAPFVIAGLIPFEAFNALLPNTFPSALYTFKKPPQILNYKNKLPA